MTEYDAILFFICLSLKLELVSTSSMKRDRFVPAVFLC